MYLVATDGEDGTPTLGRTVAAGQPDGAILGWAMFTSYITYRSREEFEADVARHCVKPESVYAWNDATTELFGWVVSECVAFDHELALLPMTQLKRSVYRVTVC
jgi:hypothetical protein